MLSQEFLMWFLNWVVTIFLIYVAINLSLMCLGLTFYSLSQWGKRRKLND